MPSAYLIQNYTPRTNNSIPFHKKANYQALITAYIVYILWILHSNFTLVL